MQKKQIYRNIILSTIQFLVVGVVFFIIYKFLLNELGVDKFRSGH
jgi:hypothetical protein